MKPALTVAVGKVNTFIFPASGVENMSGIKRVLAEKDPDYEEITITHPSKRHKAAEQSGRRSCGIGNSMLSVNRSGKDVRGKGQILSKAGGDTSV